MTNEAKYWILANKAAKEIGWLAETVFTQWAWETAHFTSTNLRNNNNIAGQTWTSGCGHDKGTPRPKAEGGYYIKYKDAAQGYVEFIKKNRRYSRVKETKTVEAQIEAIAKAGWAIDPLYAAGLKSLHQANIRDGIYKLPREEAPVYPGNIIKKGSTNTIGVRTIQKKLNITSDGVFGPKTDTAVKSFQKKHGLVVDGIVGAKTWEKLF
ncbi:glucosaminidase domain-containing protein [Neobacillus vireti]|uniref:glucosaminidase domain-containing protein n=1 Tax=Neobacillus vireti TaxID=220686 RepID=UPI003000647D